MQQQWILKRNRSLISHDQELNLNFPSFDGRFETLNYHDFEIILDVFLQEIFCNNMTFHRFVDCIILTIFFIKG